MTTKRSTAISAFYEAFALMRRPVLWVPLLLWLAFKVGLIFLYRATFLGPVGDLWALMIPAGARASLSHYPWDLIYMPLVLNRMTTVLDVFATVIFQGATIVLFAGVFRKAPVSLGEAFRHVLRRYRPVVGVTILSALALFVVLQIPTLARRLLNTSLPSKPVFLVDTVAGIVVQALFLYTLPLVLLTGYSIRAAVAASLRWARHSFPQTLLLVFVPFLLTVPTLLLGLRSNALIAQLSPEILIHLEIASEVSTMAASVVMAGALTTWFVRRRAHELVR